MPSEKSRVGITAAWGMRTKRLCRKQGHMTDLETVRAQHRVTAACRGRDAPTDTSDPFFRTSIRDAVTRRILGVIRTGAASMPRRSTTEARTGGIGHE